MNHQFQQSTLFAEDGKSNPRAVSIEALEEYTRTHGAVMVPDDQKTLLLNGLTKEYPVIFAKGNLELLTQKMVSVVGTRTPSPEGSARASQITKILVENNYVVMSGLAKGIDAIAHKTALQLNGKTIAVLGTPIHKIYPAENKHLAQEIIQHGLLLSPSLPHEETGRFLFPRRNRLMARVSLATIIIEAGPTSGVVHQAAECLRQKRKLILLKSVAENHQLPWVAGFLKSGALVAENAVQLVELLKT